MVLDAASQQGYRSVVADAQLDFSRTGPGTLAGRYLRTFWQPVYRSKDLPPGHAKPIQTLGEQFTLYRGEGGEPHLVAFRCAHRGTQLSTGWVEGDCLRCFYHGWKYDGSGQCVEMPAEDPSFPPKVQIKSYPVLEYLGLVFAYLGEGEPLPLPRYHFLEDVDETRTTRQVTTDLRPFNYRNRIENSIDPVHVAFVHRNSEFRGLVGTPTVTVEETDYGLLVRATRSDGETRISQFEMPTILHIKIPPTAPEERAWRDFLAWRVPVDDESNRAFTVTLIHMSPEAARHWALDRAPKAGPSIDELGESVLSGARHVDDFAEDASIVAVQDYVAQRGQGIIANGVGDRLGRSDVAVIQLRHLYTREMQALAEGRPLKRWTALTPMATSGLGV
ncbi:MAG TPA: aromatic ring-hydroxylating dioxygenase subunit alpha [Chloroflexota bacterium]|jgi:5,5'-dehydrodivanillate O-demethylase